MTRGNHKAGKQPDIRDEFRLLLLCARTRIEPQQRDQIRAFARKQLDWNFILDQAQSHALLPLLYRNLSGCCADHVPSAVLQQLESDYTANARRNHILTTELVRVLGILGAEDISAVPYKGPALAVLAYGDVTLRRFCDLDIVIRPKDISSGKELLLSHGYRWRPFKGQVTGKNEARNIRIWHEYNFINADNNVLIDLHWRISPRRFPFDIDLDEVWDNLGTSQLIESEIQTFRTEDLLLFLCVHGCKDLWWRRIGWICDIAQLLACNPDLDWSYSYDLATHAGARRMLLLGLALAHELLEAPLPEQVDTWIRADNDVQTLVEHVYHRLFGQETVRDRFLERQRFHGKVRERLGDKLPAYRHLVKAAFAKVFIPNYKDRELIKLPEGLSVLYYLVRPARLVHGLWAQTIRRSDLKP